MRAFGETEGLGRFQSAQLFEREAVISFSCAERGKDTHLVWRNASLKARELPVEESHELLAIRFRQKPERCEVQLGVVCRAEVLVEPALPPLRRILRRPEMGKDMFRLSEDVPQLFREFASLGIGDVDEVLVDAPSQDIEQG